MQILFGYVLSVLLLHELEGCSRAMFLRKQWRSGQTCALRRAPGADLGARPIPLQRLLTPVISGAVGEGFWEARDALAGALLGGALQAS